MLAVRMIDCFAITNYGLGLLLKKQIEAIGGQFRVKSIRAIRDQQVIFFSLPEKKLAKIYSLSIAEDIFINLDPNGIGLNKPKDLDKLDNYLNFDLPEMLNKIRKINRLDRGVEKTFAIFVKQNQDHYLRRKEISEYIGKNLKKKYPSLKINANLRANYELWGLYIDKILYLGFRITNSGHRYHYRTPMKSLSALRPTIASGLVQLAQEVFYSSDPITILDPCAGSGTLLIECQLLANSLGKKNKIIANDKSLNQYILLKKILPRYIDPKLLTISRHDAFKLPLSNNSIDLIISNLPWGEKRSDIVSIQEEYDNWLSRWSKALKDKGLLVLLIQDLDLIKQLANKLQLDLLNHYQINVLGQKAHLVKLQKK